MVLRMNNSAKINTTLQAQEEVSSETKEVVIAPVYRESSRKKELVNHPSQYGGKDNPNEVIKIVRSWDLSFSLGNCLKLILRSQKKKDDQKLEDLHKAMWYLQEEISFLYEKSLKETNFDSINA